MNNNSSIHPSAVIEKGAQLGDSVRIGPFCHVGPQVVLEAGVELLAQCSIQGDTRLGARTRVFPFASIGAVAQDLKPHGQNATLSVGSDCVLREGVTINTGTEGGGSKTVVGDKCVLLANAHVAHDCIVGNGVIMSNNTMLAGHCTVGDSVIFGGGSAVHQFSRIGHHAFIGGLAGIEGDVIPFGMATGHRANLIGLNLIGMKRAKMDRASMKAVRAGYDELFAATGPMREKAEAMLENCEDPLMRDILIFVGETSGRPFCLPAS
ncbi:acyl-ACP--UDP-N-acetylglucosamine O-acyltransferase [Ahrensia sp. R2A130]|uniref:acyl-ACP--UDP-N-acetylglucosamine O-acyltransferase n=1 Tax=Ahrensia sp. R2A130 TaxID=744979 RepID=UPI0001E0C99A|nr:acyl-ACP--UDP-N-acetylglucosamine O-acyltransferase [Ahrensia sp. R2A130]EFL90243.1 acyl-(acyl-carrier-protein)-UDP-N-acetylglucosamine O-acyltransferase [Ahrensia sp. R2A130]